MYWLLSQAAKLLPIAISLLGLWIKAFDDHGHLRRAGKPMLFGIAAIGILVYSTAEIGARSQAVKDRREREKSLYTEAMLLDAVRPQDVVVTLTTDRHWAHDEKYGTIRSILASFSSITLTFDKLSPTTDTLGYLQFTEAEQLSPYPFLLNVKETVGYSNFVGLPTHLLRTDTWNGIELHVSGSTPWQNIRGMLSQPPPHINVDSGFYTGPIRAILYVKGKTAGEGAVETGKFFFDRAVFNIPIRTAANLFDERNSFIQGPRREELRDIHRLRIIAWLSLIVAGISAPLAVARQLNTLPRRANRVAEH